MIDSDATIDNCRYCLMCRHVAPIGVLTKNETLTPHGVALTIASQRRGLVDWNEETVAIVYSDPDGGNSRAHCVTDQPLPEAIAGTRAKLVTEGLAPKVVYEIQKKLEREGSPYGAALPPSSERGEVALFVGDEAHFLHPQTVDAVTKLLNAIDISPVLVGRGRTSGYLASSLGFPDTARDQARALLDELSTVGAKRLLVLAPGDYFTFTQLYAERLDLTWPEVEVLEVVDVLAEALEAEKLSFEQGERPGYTYVDPSHAVRVPGRFDTPRKLLAALDATGPQELFWRRERAHPVGSTSLQFTRPDLAERLTKARLEDAKDRGAETLVSEDPGTLQQLKRFAPEYGLEVRCLYTLLSDALA